MSRPASNAGFSLVELMMVVSILVVLIAIAVPTTLDVSEAIRVNGAAREVERELQTARLKAVQANRVLRVRFDCPAAGQYRRFEVMNNTSDGDVSRCSEQAYPFPSPRDTNPATPAHDGPVRYLPQGMTTNMAGRALDFLPNGRAFLVNGNTREVIGGDGVSLAVSKGTHSTTVAINGLGRIQIQ